MNSFSPIFSLQEIGRLGQNSLGVTGQMWMPARSPLEMPVQDFDAPFKDTRAPALKTPSNVTLRRVLTLAPPLALTLTVTFWLGSILGADGLAVLEIIWLSLIFSTFLWISTTFASVCAGMFSAMYPNASNDQVQKKLMNIAVLSPIYNESPSHVFGNIAAMVGQLREHRVGHQFSFFLLSDTQDPEIAALEEEAMLHLRATLPIDFPVYYRRRAQNIDRKTGNLAQWVRNWGGAFDAMLIYDADSLMSANGMHQLADKLAENPSLALVQTCPRLFGSETFFGRMQQFSSAAFGLLPSLGEAFWSNREANYHGHNAIVRTEAFATCAGLPYLQNRNGSETLIFSHDFVEAALLRRAGWGVEMVPLLEPTYEETPTTLIDYVLRDRRWCQGNMQHLRIMWSKGLHPVSRFHLGMNALTYLMSPLWFALVLIGSALGTSAGGGLLSALTGRPASDFINFAVLQSQGLWLLGLVYLMLIAPKLAGLVMVLLPKSKANAFNGRSAFIKGFCVELIGSMAIAPILMVQQTRAILGILIGCHENWNPQKRYAARYDALTVLRFHMVETAVGAVLMTGILVGAVSFWLLPIGISLLSAPILSALSGLRFPAANHALFTTPFEAEVPAIVSDARRQQGIIAIRRTAPLSTQMAAE